MSYPTKRLGEVVDFRVAKNTKLFPYVGMEDVESGTGRFIGSREPRRVQSTTAYFATDSVLYGKLRPYLNKVFMADFEGHCTTEFIPLRPDPSALTREWLAMWLQSESVVEEISGQTTGSRMPRADISYLKQMRIPVPPVEEQRKIVEKIEKQFAKIDEAARLRAESQDLAAELLPAALHEIFSSIESKGWDVRTIEEVTELVTKGTTPKTYGHAFTSSGIPFLKAENINGIVQAESAGTFISKKTHDFLARSKTKSGDVLMTIAGTIGRVGWIPAGEQEMNLNQAVAVIRPKQNLISTEYLACVLSAASSQEQVGKGTVKMAIPNFSLGMIKKIKIPLPPLEEQMQIVKKLDALSKKVRALQELQKQQSVDLKALKQSILRETFYPLPVRSNPPVIVQRPVPSPFQLNQVNAAIIEQVRKDGGETTEVAVAKYNHLLQELCGVPLAYQFQERKFGPFDGRIKRMLYSAWKNNSWFNKDGIMLVPGKKMGALLTRKTSLYFAARDAMKMLSNIGITELDTTSLELLSTVCHSIKQTKSTDIGKIRAFMESWETDQERTKAQKFTVTRTKRCLDFIRDHKLDQKLLV